MEKGGLALTLSKVHRYRRISFISTFKIILLNIFGADWWLFCLAESPGAEQALPGPRGERDVLHRPAEVHLLATACRPLPGQGSLTVILLVQARAVDPD